MAAGVESATGGNILMRIPCVENLRVDQSKVVDYLLSESRSRGKATFFLRYGFQPQPRVRTVWIMENGSSEPRLITAHPV